MLEEVGQSNGQLTSMMVAYRAGLKLPEAVRKTEPFQAQMRSHAAIAEKDLAWVLALARELGISLPVGGLVSQLMARIYQVDDPKRR